MSIIYEVKGHTVIVTRSQPRVLNAINDEMTKESSDVWSDIRNDRNISTSVVTSEGNDAFSFGADTNTYLAGVTSDDTNNAQPDQSRNKDPVDGVLLIRPVKRGNTYQQRAVTLFGN